MEAARPLAAVAEPELPKGSPSPRGKPTPVAAATPVRVPAGGVADGEPASPAAEAPSSPPAPRLSPVPPARPTAAARPGGLRKAAEPEVPAGAGLPAVNEPAAHAQGAGLIPAASEPAAEAVSKRPPSAERPQSALMCPICLETVAEGEGRSTAALACGHKFHLSCIGSAFNAKGAMVCPLCRREEDEEWRYADGLRAEDDWDPADLGDADAALFYPSEDDYDDDQDDTDYWCEELPVLWRIHAAPLRYSGDLTDEEEYDEDEDEDEDDVGDDELDDDASIDEDFEAEDDEYVGVRALLPPVSRAHCPFQRPGVKPLHLPASPKHAHCMREHADIPACVAFELDCATGLTTTVDSQSRRQVFLRGRPMIVHQYVELSHVYDRGQEHDELDDSISAATPESASRIARAVDANLAATTEADTAAAAADDASADPVPEEDASDLALSAVSQDTRARTGATGGASEANTRAMAGARLRPAFPMHVLDCARFARALSLSIRPHNAALPDA